VGIHQFLDQNKSIYSIVQCTVARIILEVPNGQPRAVCGESRPWSERGHLGGARLGDSKYARHFQNATFIPVTFDAGAYTQGNTRLPRVDAMAAKDASGKLWVEITNLDPEKPLQIHAELAGLAAKSASGETLTAPTVDSINTFAAPKTVVPKPISVKVQDGGLTLTVEPKSVTVVSLEQ
jgi:hypothetical protein